MQRLPKWRKKDINFKLQEYIHSTHFLASELSNWPQRNTRKVPNGQTNKGLQMSMYIKNKTAEETSANSLKKKFPPKDNDEEAESERISPSDFFSILRA